ncbi:hypothetical protein PACTADRAFT_48211 [Pachysolen tannophilus NRRL Y-2460]|uniref:CAP-Gly domain-containing protein n=1 Tax=Pachysolen tannophilus NRRL Y-2460 TaxID=669874 RepID=A0A1E4U370_PACTA|nr:hypothetical protein PACTADRAFT_48211 [Pachysolen tannophilus NRRL Y-2460]
MDINVYITSPLTSTEKRISVQWTLKYFKEKLELITGIKPEFQELLLYPISNSNETVPISSKVNLGEDQTLLSEFGISSYMRIHVNDINPEAGELDYLSSNNNDNDDDYKFELTKEEYEKRSDSVISWKRQNKLGRFDPEYEKRRKELILKNDQLSKKLQIGLRCKVHASASFNEDEGRIGTIRYVGSVKEIDGDGNNKWVGVEFDEPVGKNDGSIISGGKHYFTCHKNYGSFVKPILIEIGDFAEKPLFDSDDEL